MEKNTVRITMEGGIIQDVDVPDGIKVIVRDYDTDGVEEGELARDYDGNMYVETEWQCRSNSKDSGVTKFSDQKLEAKKW